MYKKKKHNISCTNCEKVGHVLRHCTQPITSYGIIVYKYTDDFNEGDLNDNLQNLLKNYTKNEDNSEDIKILMIQRKDTMGYTDFLRGRYNRNYIGMLFLEMTIEEQHNLLTKTFEELWSSLWINHAGRSYKNEYTIAKKKFSQLNIIDLINKYKSNYISTEFSFPKGRKGFQLETYKECAEREFNEETGYNHTDYEPIDLSNYITEEFIGTDNIEYKHVYYITKVKKGKIINPRITNLLQMEEVKDIGWFTINEALSLMRPYDVAKKNVICSFLKQTT